MKPCSITLLLLVVSNLLCSQTKSLFENLPVGKYNVGFKIITLTDSTRVAKPRYNYFGEKETADIHQIIKIHIWYPAKPNSGKGKLTYGEYSYSHLLGSVNETFAADKKANAFNNARETFQGFFGPVTDENWENVLHSTFLAHKDADHIPQKFPLLIGMLRPLSTNITNEVLASNGYIIAMVVSTSGRLPAGYITDVRDMQHAMACLISSGIVDGETIGAYGFSGSGFSQVLLAMNDPRIIALADIESALYGEGIWDIFSSSDLYNAANLRIPFLHIYGTELGKSDRHFDKFHEKKYSHRYHLSLNYPQLHHWDLATEGRSSTTVVHVRGEKEPGIKASFELANQYLLHFFEATLKKSAASHAILNNARSIRSYKDSLWTFKHYPALPSPPNRAQFETIIIRKGIDSATKIARRFYEADSTVDFLHENSLNALARQFRSQNKPKEGLDLMLLAVEFHPREAWLWNNLADMYENSGNKPEAIRCSEKVLQLLKNFKGADQSFNERIKRSSTARLQRLQKS